MDVAEMRQKTRREGGHSRLAAERETQALPYLLETGKADVSTTMRDDEALQGAELGDAERTPPRVELRRVASQSRCKAASRMTRQSGLVVCETRLERIGKASRCSLDNQANQDTHTHGPRTSHMCCPGPSSTAAVVACFHESWSMRLVNVLHKLAERSERSS